MPTPDSAETMRRVLEQERAEIHVALPGRVRSYDQAAQTAEIELEIKRVMPSGDDDEPDIVDEYPILPAVPVLCLRGSGFFMHFPQRAGDKVTVLFCEADLNEWRRTGVLSDPGVSTRHGLSGAVCIPGIHHQRNPLGSADIGAPSFDSPPYLTLGLEGGPIIRIDGSTIQAGGGDALARWAGVEAHLDAINTTLGSLTGDSVFSTPYNKATVELAAQTPTTILKGA